MKKIVRFLATLLTVSVFIFLFNSQDALASNSQVDTSLQYLIEHQEIGTGGITEEGETIASQMLSDWTAIAFTSGKYSPDSIGSPSLLQYTTGDACQLTQTTDIERKVLAFSASGIDISKISECNLISKIVFNVTDGSVEDNLVATVFGVLAFRSQNLDVPQETISYIISQQDANGGWSSGWGTESNFTAQTIMALASTNYDANSAIIAKAKQYLKNLQTDTGGIKYDTNSWTTESDAFSDAYTIQAIFALGEDPNSSYWKNNNKTIFDDLDNLRQEDGSYWFSRSFGAMNPVYTTAIVVPALNHAPLPFFGADLTSFTRENETPTVLPSKTEKFEDTDTISDAATPSPTRSLEDNTNHNKVTHANIDTPASQVNNTQIDALDTANSQISTSASYKSNKYLIIAGIGALTLGILLSFSLSKFGVLPIIIFMIMLCPAKSDASQAGLYIKYQNKTPDVRCIDFDGQITGVQLLEKAGLSPVLQNGFLVTIDGETAKASTDAGAGDEYWSYWLLDNGRWTYARAGATSQKVKDGDVEGWQHGSSNLSLPQVAFSDICTKNSQDTVIAAQSQTPFSQTNQPQNVTSKTISTTDTASTDSSATFTSANNTEMYTINTNTKKEDEKNNYTNILLFCGLMALGFTIHRIIKLRNKNC